MRFLTKYLSILTALILVLNPLAPLFGQSLSPRSQSFLIEGGKDIKGNSFGTVGEENNNRQIPEDPYLRGYPSPESFLEGAGLSYQVHILGEVNKPGTYRVSASTRLSEAIEKADGILERGSIRKIELRRREGGKKIIDLLSFKVLGNLDANPYLLDNDVIYVPLRDRVVEIQGAVKRPGVYELKNEKSLEDLVQLVGGFTPGVGNPVPVKVIRFDHGKKSIVDIENREDERRQFALEDSDVIVVPHILTENKHFDYNIARLPGDNKLFYPSYEDRVFMLGGVAKPGPYPFSPYYNVRQYLTIAGGATRVAKIKKLKILTVDGKTKKGDVNSEVNPGDTIIVPEKYLAPETFATIVVGITASLVGITAAVVSLTN